MPCRLPTSTRPHLPALHSTSCATRAPHLRIADRRRLRGAQRLALALRLGRRDAVPAAAAAAAAASAGRRQLAQDGVHGHLCTSPDR